MHGTAGQLLINAVLPPDLRRPDRVLDKKGIQLLLQEVADKHPDRFSQVLFDLSQIGQRVAYDTGGQSFGLAHLRPTAAARATQIDLRRQVQAVYADPTLSADDKRAKVVGLLGDAGGPMQDDLYADSLAEDNPLAMQVLSGARGNKGNLRSLRGGDLLYVDHRDRPIPVPVLRSYAQGLSPAEFLAGTFGARKGVVDTKLCLAHTTLVLMADHSEKEIRRVAVGDTVMGADRTGRTFPTRVVNVFDNGTRLCHRYRFRRGSKGPFLELVATEDHKVLARANGSVSEPTPLPLSMIEFQGDPTANAYVALPAKRGTVEKQLGCKAYDRERVGDVPTFDLEVDHPDHLFVLANGLIVSNSTQNAGFLGKQLTQSAHRLVVTDLDGDGEPDVVRGLPVDVSDPDNEGALLAAPTGGYPRNTVLTPKILSDLQGKVEGDILVRSPLVGGPADGGVYGRDVGLRERGTIPPRGDFVGIAAAQAASEPLSQSQLCLAEGTRVRMADGTTKAIEFLKTGDAVLGADRTGATFPVAVLTRFDNGLRVCETFARRDWSVTCTPDHKVLCYDSTGGDSRVAPIGDVARCLLVFAAMSGTGDSEICFGGVYRRSMGSRVAAGERPTFDIEVDHPDHLFVLANGLIVSNSSKHAGGVAGAAKGVSGFALVNALTQVPRTFPGGAAHASKDGRVTAIRPAPQGGHFVAVGGFEHYVKTGLDPSVKVGDDVEAGDVLSGGTPNPAEIVRHKGVGEGRRYFVQAFKAAYDGAGIPIHRRNAELIARGLINHVRMTEETDDHLPDDVVPYSRLEASWRPRDGYTVEPPAKAHGLYLEKPTLHYTVGTRITPAVSARLAKHGVAGVTVHRDPPPFEPEMVRGMESVTHDPDWLTRMMGSYLQRSLLRGVHRADVSDSSGTSYVPALAQSREFGRVGQTVGFVAPPAAPPSGPPPPRSILSGLIGQPADDPDAATDSPKPPPRPRSLFDGLAGAG
jgi:hypothetical protein